MVARFGYMVNKWTVTAVAALALMAVVLATALPAWAQNDNRLERDYAENGADPVATFTAVDPEGRTVYWSLLESHQDSNNAAIMVDGTALMESDVADHGDFKISMDGVLNFKFPPNYDTTTPANNIKKVVVVSSDDALGVTGRMMEYHKVTVTITDVDEDGRISLSALQPQVGVALTATLTDQDSRSGDNPIINAVWKWEQSPAMGGPWTLIPGAGDSPTVADNSGEPDIKASDDYTPAKAIAGMYLRATATYTDKHGDDKPAMAVSAHAVRATPAGGNSAPEFSAGEMDSRNVKENSPPGTAVGKPVTAGDAGDVLTYTLHDDGSSTGDHQNYTIDWATGQIMVGPRTKLNLEAPNLTDMVVVRATDPYGDPNAEDCTANTNCDEVTVTITIDNVNEAPKIIAGPTKDSKAEDFDSRADLSVGTRELVVATYTATDNDLADTATTIKWSLTGADAADFDIDRDTASLEIDAELSFKNAPNYEMPADADMDNMYMVTVVATDAKKLTATRDVVITVINANEGGSVTFSSVQPKVGIPFTASLSDPDGDTTGEKWEWMRTSDGTTSNAAGCSSGDSPDFDTAIDEEDSGSYTPKEADLYQCLQAKATYTDPVGSTMAMGVSANAVVPNNDNVAPEFREGGAKPVMQATRNIDENSVSDSLEEPNPGNVGDAVEATDANGSGDILTYTLGGPDKDAFDIGQATGQITVAEDTKLDYESNKKTYMVTVTATDPSGATGSIDVTINVDDVDEDPEFTAPSEGDVDKTIKENTRSLSIYTFRANDPEGRKVYWSLGTEDATSPDRDHFTISDGGVLSLNASPNYEDETAPGPDSQYMVVVVASDDAPGAGIGTAPDGEDPIGTSEKTVTVTVEDEEETGVITTSPKNPHVDNPVVAMLADDDGDPTITWEWTVSSGDPQGTGADTGSYTPVAGDVGKTLRVKASYTENGEDKTVGPFSAGTVRADPVNTDPAFDPITASRRVAENARNTRLGNPIRATDADRDTLTYTVNNTNFSISSSGQLSTAAMLDHEDDDGDMPTVTITATDPWGGIATNTVTVTVVDVNEAPVISMGPTRKDHAENTTTSVGDYDATDVDDGDTAALTWSLEGEDAAKFNIVEADGMLTFKESPNFEAPTDRNKDNVYKVTVVVSDDGTPKLTDKRQVEITVTDLGEDGVVTLSAVQPKTGINLMASLTDPDNVTPTNANGSIDTGITWQWWKSVQDNVGTAPAFLTTDGDPDTDATDGWEKIANAKSDTYKPVPADAAGTEGKWLTAMATYTDRSGTETMYESSANAVIINTDNVAPMFKDDNDEEITEATRKVAETAKPNEGVDEPASIQGNVGPRVMATDPNGDDLLTYALSGDDAASFKITSDTGSADDSRGGQISLKDGTKLNYEDKTSYMVTVTAADPDREMASVDVTIKVTDVDEAPEIMLGGLAISAGPYNPDHPEDSSADVGTYQAVGSMKDSASWTLNGNDASHFMLEGSPGMSVTLKFKNAPDYEMPMDADMDNVYEVSVEATDSESNTAMRAVTVTVINLDEDGTVDLSSMTPVVGVALTATLTDLDSPDGVPADGITWQWSKSMTMDGEYMVIDGATMMSYTPVEADDGYYLMVKVMYTDGHGSGKEQMATTTGMVTTVPDQPGMVDLSSMTPVVGVALTASLSDPDGSVTGETWMWYKSMDSTFMNGNEMEITDGVTSDGAMSSYTPMAADDGYYLMVKVMYTDGHGADKEQMATTGMVTTVQDQPGAVSLSPMTPVVGVELTATLSDPDGGMTGQTWMWSKSMTMDGTFMDIAGATSMNYTPMAADANYYLMVKVMYTDGHGSGKMATATSANAVTAVTAGDPLVARYDANNNGEIEKSEVITAINDYLFGTGADAPSKAAVIELINLYLFGSGS